MEKNELKANGLIVIKNKRWVDCQCYTIKSRQYTCELNRINQTVLTEYGRVLRHCQIRILNINNMRNLTKKTEEKTKTNTFGASSKNAI